MMYPHIKVDLILGLGVAVCPDGTAGKPTRAVSEKVIEVYRSYGSPDVLLCGGYSQSGVSEAEAMRRILATEGIHERVWIDQDPIHVRGTPFQLKTVERIFSHTLPSYPKQLILVAHPLHLPRAIWLFRRAFPKVQFLPASSQQVYDTTVSQRRLHSRWRFLLWNGLAWVHHLMAVVASGDTKTPFIKSSIQ